MATKKTATKTVNPTQAAPVSPISGRTAGELATRMMLVILSISQWQASKVDREVTDEVHVKHNTNSEAGAYRKKLIAKESMATITKVVSEARTVHMEFTLPWLNDGYRAIQSCAYERYMAKVRELQSKFETAVDGFVANYPAYVEESKVRLNGMFKADDYPPASEIREKFSLETFAKPLPTETDFRVSLSDLEMRRVRDSINETTQWGLEAAMFDVSARVYQVAERMAERLRAYKPAAKKGEKAENTFKDTLVSNLTELAKLLPDLNITGDPRITEMQVKLTELGKIDPDTLRDDEKKRNDVAAQAEAIMSKMESFI